MFLKKINFNTVSQTLLSNDDFSSNNDLTLTFRNMACSCTLVNILAVVATIVAVGYAFIKWIYSYWQRRNIPYIEPSFPFGNLLNPYLTENAISFGDRVSQLYSEAKAKGKCNRSNRLQ